MMNEKESHQHADKHNVRLSEMKTIDPEILDRLVTKNPHNLPYAHHRGGVPINPNDMDQHKQQTLQAMYQQTEEQLGQIFEQMQLLAKQAKKIQDRIEISKKVYLASYNFKPGIGHLYYLYQQDESYILSLLGPQDLKSSQRMASYQFIASVELLADRTWKVISDES